MGVVAWSSSWRSSSRTSARIATAPCQPATARSSGLGRACAVERATTADSAQSTACPGWTRCPSENSASLTACSKTGRAASGEIAVQKRSRADSTDGTPGVGHCPVGATTARGRRPPPRAMTYGECASSSRGAAGLGPRSPCAGAGSPAWGAPFRAPVAWAPSVIPGAPAPAGCPCAPAGACGGARSSAREVVEERVGDRRHEQRQQQRQRLPADDDDGDRAALLGAGAGAERERQHAGDQRERRHEDRPQAVAVALDDRRLAAPCPAARRWFMWSIWRIEFFFTTPKSTRMPERRVEVERVAASATARAARTAPTAAARAGSSAGGPGSRNCDARIMYMKMIESRNAQRNSRERALQLARRGRETLVV